MESSDACASHVRKNIGGYPEMIDLVCAGLMGCWGCFVKAVVRVSEIGIVLEGLE